MVYGTYYSIVRVLPTVQDLQAMETYILFAILSGKKGKCFLCGKSSYLGHPPPSKSPCKKKVLGELYVQTYDCSISKHPVWKVWIFSSSQMWLVSVTLCTIFTILLTLWNSEQKNGLLIKFICFSSDFDETWWSCSTFCVLQFHQVSSKSDEKQKSFINSPFFCSEFQSVSRIDRYQVIIQPSLVHVHTLFIALISISSPLC